ncbi:hypothetical protein AMTR_s00004p00211480, partial [Amborella trichopoda]
PSAETWRPRQNHPDCNAGAVPSASGHVNVLPSHPPAGAPIPSGQVFAATAVATLSCTVDPLQQPNGSFPSRLGKEVCVDEDPTHSPQPPALNEVAGPYRHTSLTFNSLSSASLLPSDTWPIKPTLGTLGPRTRDCPHPSAAFSLPF